MNEMITQFTLKDTKRLGDRLERYSMLDFVMQYSSSQKKTTKDSRRSLEESLHCQKIMLSSLWLP